VSLLHTASVHKEVEDSDRAVKNIKVFFFYKSSEEYKSQGTFHLTSSQERSEYSDTSSISRGITNLKFCS
jgi:hypothetical protein